MKTKKKPKLLPKKNLRDATAEVDDIEALALEAFKQATDRQGRWLVIESVERALSSLRQTQDKLLAELRKTEPGPRGIIG